ncbi:MAG: pyridoxal-phosphate dependent enzyme, partial [Geminicoccaceae bacterium]
IDRVPRLVAVDPERCNGLQRALAAGPPRAVSVAAEHPPATILGKLCHACPPDGAHALSALWGSGGTVIGVSDKEAMAAQRELAGREGLYLEVSSVVILPAVRRLLTAGFVHERASVVALACGSGYRALPFNPLAVVMAEIVALADFEHAVGAVSC